MFKKLSKKISKISKIKKKLWGQAEGLTFLPVNLVDRVTTDRTVQDKPFPADHRPIRHWPNDRRSVHVQMALVVHLADFVEGETLVFAYRSWERG